MTDKETDHQVPRSRARTTSNVITFGTFDLFHRGHLNILNGAKEAGRCKVHVYRDRPDIWWWGQDPTLIVGVSSDKMNYDKKKKYPVMNQEDRMAIVGALSLVDKVFLEESMEQKRDYIKEHDAHVLVMGDDWYRKFDDFKDICEVVYLPRTPSISTTMLIDKIVK